MGSEENEIQEEITSKISQLRKIVRYYKGFDEQKNAFYFMLDELRTEFRSCSAVFSAEIVQELNEMKKKIDSYHEEKIIFRKHIDHKSSNNEMNKGFLVYHKIEHYVGVVERPTTLVDLFEKPEDKIEYRIIISDNEVRIASKDNITVLGNCNAEPRIIAHCYGCREVIDSDSDKCTECNWYKCSSCGACGCEYIGRVGSDNDFY